MRLLGIDIGSSSVKAAILVRDRAPHRIVRAPLPTRFAGARAEVDPAAVLSAIRIAIGALGRSAQAVDAIGLSVMAPSWLAMDRRGVALTPIVTHQDRRSAAIALEIEARVGRDRHLAIVGNRPFPGGISSTTWAWYAQHEPARLRRADLVGHLSTFIHRQLTGARVTDPSNASFTGVYRTCDLGGWSEELCEMLGLAPALLPQVREADEIAGTITASAAHRFGLRQGTPMMAGIMDGSAGMLAAGARVGQLLNGSGSTDVLALCVDRFAPDPRLLTRALGVRGLWLSVSTIAAAGSSLAWAREQLFADWSVSRFRALMMQLAATAGSRSARSATAPHTVDDAADRVCFEPYLAGERTSVEQRRGAFTGLTLATTRQQMLAAIIEALAAASAQRIPLLQGRGVRILRKVITTGGVDGSLARILRRDWPGRWDFAPIQEATLRGLAQMTPRQ